MNKFYAVLVLILLGFFSCTSPMHIAENAKVIPGVPFYPQEEYQCGPASLATVMNYYSARMNTEIIPVEQIAQAIYSPTARGVLPTDLENYARKRGFSPHQFEGSIEELHLYIDRNEPVIIFVDHGITLYQINHFMVATGYTNKGIIFNNGRQEGQLIDNSRLERIWRKTGYWALYVAPL